MNFGGDHPAHGHGKISPRCVPVLPAVARYRPDAFPSCRPWQDCALMRSRASHPWQDIAPMRSRRGLGREKRQFAATYRRHVFRYSLFWQDMRAMCPKRPAKRRWGIHRANILPPSGGPAPAQGPLPGQPHHGIVLQRPGPCSGTPTPTPRQLPMPATCRAHCSQRQAADGLRRRSFGAWPAVWPSPEGPPTASSRRAGRQRNVVQSWA